MTADALLDLARAGDVEALGAERAAVANAVHELARSGEAASACELVGRAWRIWFVRDELDQGTRALATALNAPDVESAGIWRVRALYADGVFAFRAGERDRSLARNEEALRAARELDDVRGECDALTGLARVAAWSNLNQAAISIARGDASEAQRRFSAGKQALDDLDAALDPDDQFEFDWLSARVSGIEA